MGDLSKEDQKAPKLPIPGKRNILITNALPYVNNVPYLELKHPKCKVCKTSPRIRNTNHLFLELPLLKDKLEEYIKKASVDGCWSQNAVQATNAWNRDGLKPRCITRDLKWGVPFPMMASGTRCSMCGSILPSDTSPLLSVTLPIGRSGGRIRMMWSCISLLARIMFHSIRSCFPPRFLELAKIEL
ncbi:hypothetical protein M0R45_015567 [Rubus argutus]|uniref:Methionyl/Leucyl tRNA synthetase domain-containing protein n=1 Tax=Rubus argutus TaxID=59490 RepID=A0AAW1XSF8_RUBAR